jgi:hypothetical protein
MGNFNECEVLPTQQQSSEIRRFAATCERQHKVWRSQTDEDVIDEAIKFDDWRRHRDR